MVGVKERQNLAWFSGRVRIIIYESRAQSGHHGTRTIGPHMRGPDEPGASGEVSGDVEERRQEDA